MELWAEFLNTKTQNGIPFVRERTVFDHKRKNGALTIFKTYTTGDQ